MCRLDGWYSRATFVEIFSFSEQTWLDKIHMHGKKAPDHNQMTTRNPNENQPRYPGPSRIHLSAFPPKERWNDWTELDSQAWPRRKERRYSLVPTTCFNCESACGLLAYIDKDTNQIQ